VLKKKECILAEYIEVIYMQFPKEGEVMMAYKIT
jgi:hypothetical protein